MPEHLKDRSVTVTFHYSAADAADAETRGDLVDRLNELGNELGYDVEHKNTAEERLALWFTPQAIRDHFDGDEGTVVDWVHGASDDELRALGEECLGADTLYSEFHRLLVEVGEEHAS